MREARRGAYGAIKVIVAYEYHEPLMELLLGVMTTFGCFTLALASASSDGLRRR